MHDKMFEELDYRQTPLGELTLWKRKYLSLGGEDVYEVKLGDDYLMSSLFHEVEEALATEALNLLDPQTKADIVVGGLGLGYTAHAALQHAATSSMIIIEMMSAVIEWHESGLVPLGKEISEDHRTRYVCDDFFKLSQQPTTGFDPPCHGRRFHAILLDIDHSPKHYLDQPNAFFYSQAGLSNLRQSLHDKGVFALWSNDPPEPDFIHRLEEVFPSVERRLIHFQNPLLGKESSNTLYLAQNG